MDFAFRIFAGVFFRLRNDERGKSVSHLQIIERLCRMLDEAQAIIRRQEALLALHGIQTDNGNLEETRRKLLRDIEQET